jgi:hypothetical protein
MRAEVCLWGQAVWLLRTQSGRRQYDAKLGAVKWESGGNLKILSADSRL